MVSSSAVFSKRDGARARKASITSVPDDAGDSRRAQPSAVHVSVLFSYIADVQADFFKF